RCSLGLRYAFVVADSHEDVASRLENAVTPAFGPRLKALEAHALLDHDACHLQFVDVRAVVVFRIGDGRFEHLLYDRRTALRAERENVERALDRLAADLIGNQPTLLRRQTHPIKFRLSFHVVLLAPGFL